MLSATLSQTVLATEADQPGQWRRLLRISLDGLKSHNTDPPPEAPARAGAPGQASETT
ncbi:hypothetical protein [Streptomyces sp. NPDC091215]|uniref:hypothetical protein n=1 Tax=Streptomyces sp. NPDC091215 TaxID=3155192 RepID=UPI0034154E51